MGPLSTAMVVIQRYLQEKKERINAALAALLPPVDSQSSTLSQAMRYSLLGRGKRIRPILAVAAFEAVDGETECIFPFACAVEMVHAYSLIHDDLPAMDDDDFRRGRPTTHRLFGEAMAILAGDALLTEAFQAMSRGALDHNVDSALAIDIIYEISLAAGASGMVGGQAADMEAEGREVNLPTVDYIHTHKTGALILASVRMGAKLGRASPEQLEAITSYGERIGLVFQIVDDVLNVTGRKAKLGKTVGSDEARKKATYPALVGVTESKRLAESLVEEAIASLEILGKPADPLRGIARYLVRRKS
jgi:geranylgeranyl diphosphate synthase type II